VACGEAFGDAADGFDLVEAVGNSGVDGDGGKGLAGGALVDAVLKAGFGIEAEDGARGLAGVPNFDVVAVGGEDDGALGEFGFEGVGVRGGLGAASGKIFGGAFGFDDGQGLAVVIPEDVVGAVVVGEGVFD